jgi:imidazolonepropionase-like amidohydrolase
MNANPFDLITEGAEGFLFNCLGKGTGRDLRPLASSPPGRNERMARMILKNCKLIPELCEGFEQETADLRLDGKKIAEVLPAGGNYTGEEVLDVKGATVLPGLFNCHEHFYFTKNSFPFLHDFDDTLHMLHSINYAQELLTYGFTFVKDCGSIHDTAIKLRDGINAGLIEGPNVLAAGPSNSPHFMDEGLLDIYSSTKVENHPITDVSMIRNQVAMLLSRGADFIKLCGSSRKPEVKKPQDLLGQPLFTYEEVAEFVKWAEYYGTYVTMHSTCVESHDMGIEAGVWTLDHDIYLTQEQVDKIVAKGNKTNLVPTLAVSYVGYKEGWPTYDVCHPGAGNAMRMAHDAGINVGFGTDDFQKDFNKMPAVEWVARSEFGISNLDLLKQATINSAKICKCEKKRGTIKVGKLADLAIVDGDPLQDLMVFNVPCAYVFKNGKLVADHGVMRNGTVKTKVK